MYTRGGSGSRNPFSCTVTRTRLSRVLEDWFSSGAFVILSSTSSSQNFLVPRTPAREKDKEDTVRGACLHPSRDFRAARVLAERLTFAFSEWSTAGSQGIARRSTKCRRPSHRANATNQSFGFPSLFDDFLTGQITPSVLSRSGQTLRIETSREKKKVLPSNCLENVWTNVSIERKF